MGFTKLPTYSEQFWDHPAPNSITERDLFFLEEVARREADHFVVQPPLQFCLSSSKLEENLNEGNLTPRLLIQHQRN
jgi:hypothetical protein